MSRIVVPGGQSHVPPEVAEKLKDIDPRLFIRPAMSMYQDNVEGGSQQHHTWVWHVCLKWPEGDPRYARIQSGEIAPEHACDLVATIPAALRLDEVPGYVARHMTVSVTPAAIANKIAQWNQDQQLRAGAATVDFAAELFKVNRKSIAENPYNPAMAKRAEKNARPE
jgi:hypothetical protein